MRLASWFAPKPKNLVGVDIGSSCVKVASLKGNSQTGYQLEALGMESLPEDTIVDGVVISKLPVADAIRKIFTDCKIRNDRIATSISGHSVIVKRVSLPAQAESDLRESIQWEAQQYIPYDISDVNVDYQVLRRSADSHKIEVLLVAAKREKINDHTSVVSMAGKMSSVVDIDAFALQNVFEANYDPEPGRVTALLNIGSAVMNINIMKGREFLFTRDIAIGGNQYTDFLKKELGLSTTQAEHYKRGDELTDELHEEVSAVLNSVSENLALEVEKTFDYFRTTTNSTEIHEILLSGGGSRTTGLREYLERKFQIPVDYLDPFRSIRVDEKEFSSDVLNQSRADFAVAVGLALRSTNER